MDSVLVDEKGVVQDQSSWTVAVLLRASETAGVLSASIISGHLSANPLIVPDAMPYIERLSTSHSIGDTTPLSFRSGSARNRDRHRLRWSYNNFNTVS
jgi:hypothetical protein